MLDRLISDCETHLQVHNAGGTAIESYFVQYILTRICAEYENRIGILVRRRCSRTRDAHVKQFLERSAREAAKRFNISDIKGTLERFGDDYKTAFHNSIANTAAHVAWDNIYTNRHGVAHGGGAQMSFMDLKRDYADSLLVLDAIVNALRTC
jgi:hypothetical protein